MVRYKLFALVSHCTFTAFWCRKPTIFQLYHNRTIPLVNKTARLLHICTQSIQLHAPDSNTIRWYFYCSMYYYTLISNMFFKHFIFNKFQLNPVMRRYFHPERFPVTKFIARVCDIHSVQTEVDKGRCIRFICPGRHPWRDGKLVGKLFDFLETLEDLFLTNIAFKASLLRKKCKLPKNVAKPYIFLH